MVNIDECDTFKDLGKDSPAPMGYNKIQVHLVYYVKYDGSHTARLVAYRQLTDIPVEYVYLGRGSLLGI